MKIHEYQAKQLLREAGVPVPRGIVVKSADEAAKAFGELGGAIAVVKAQIHAGGRGKGRFKEHPDQAGVVLVKSADEARENASRMLGNTLVTIQTGDEGKVVNGNGLNQILKQAKAGHIQAAGNALMADGVDVRSTNGSALIPCVARRILPHSRPSRSGCAARNLWSPTPRSTSWFRTVCSTWWLRRASRH